LNLGATIVLAPDNNLNVAANLLISQGITTAVMTPPIAVGVSRILDKTNQSPMLGILKFVLVGGKNFSPVDKLFCNRILKNTVHEYYGTTETGVNTIAEPDDILSKSASVGRAYDGNEILVFDQKGNPVPTGETGRIGVHSYMNMTGYVGSEADSVMIENRCFLLTNEAGYLDNEGYLFLRNRNVRISTSSIYDVENEIKRLPCISDVVLIPKSNKKKTNVACAFTMVEDALSEPEDIAQRITQIAKKAKLQISSISNLEQIPYSPSGKVVSDKIIGIIRQKSIKTNESWRTSTLIGTGLLFVTAMAWGGMFHIAKSTLTTIDAFHVSLIRYGLAAVIFLSMLLFKEGISALFPGKDTLKLWFFGTLGFAGFSILAFWGLAASKPEHGAIIMALMPFLTVIVMLFWKGVSISKFTICCILIAFCGVLLVITKGNVASIYGGSLIPNLAIMAGACCWVIYTIGAREFEKYSILRYTALSASLGALSIFALTAIGIWTNLLTIPTVEQMSQFKFELAYLVVIAGVMAVFSWNKGIRMLGPVSGVLFINLVPVTALIFGWWKGHIFYDVELIGGAITVAALVFSNLNERAAFKNLYIKYRQPRSQIAASSS
jgi:drug/metabolite transporter (DMT)-like permease